MALVPYKDTLKMSVGSLHAEVAGSFTLTSHIHCSRHLKSMLNTDADRECALFKFYKKITIVKCALFIATQNGELGMSAKTFGTFRRKTKTEASRPDEWPGR